MKKINLIITIFIFIALSSIANCEEKDNKGTNMSSVEEKLQKSRKNMVKSQIIRRGVNDALVIKAMETVKRHLFIPESHQKEAYNDHPLPIGYNQTISQPYIVAFMTEILRLKGTEKVLEIGTGSGYQAAVLGEIVKEVYTIEIVTPLAERAEKVLKELNYKNVFVKSGDGYAGWPEQAPFDAIIVTAAPDHIPEPLIKQLKIGGKLIIPVGTSWQELILLEKTEDGIKKRNVLAVRFVPMTGEAIDE